VISRCNCQIFASHCEWDHCGGECRSSWELKSELVHRGRRMTVYETVKICLGKVLKKSLVLS